MAHMLLLEYKKKYNVEGGKQSCNKWQFVIYGFKYSGKRFKTLYIKILLKLLLSKACQSAWTAIQTY